MEQIVTRLKVMLPCPKVRKRRQACLLSAMVEMSVKSRSAPARGGKTLVESIWERSVQHNEGND